MRQAAVGQDRTVENFLERDYRANAMITGDCSANPCPVTPQSYGVLVYFYWHKIAGWVLGSFLVAGLAGLTQRN